MNLADWIRSFPDFPKKGILFRDICPLLKDPQAFNEAITRLAEIYEKRRFDLIAAIEARGFIFGSVLAHRLGKGLIPVRKEGKLPGKRVTMSYDIEYGSATMEVQEDAVRRGERALVVDDLLATGGTARAAAKLIERLGGEVMGIAFVIELAPLKGREQLKGYDVTSLVVFD